MISKPVLYLKKFQHLYCYFLIRFAQEHDLVFCETSAKTGENVEEAFLKCSKTILAKIETGELDPGELMI